MGAGLGFGFYYLPEDLGILRALGEQLGDRTNWSSYISPILLGPPLLLSAAWLSLLSLVSVSSALWGALSGAWKSFFR